MGKMSKLTRNLSLLFAFISFGPVTVACEVGETERDLANFRLATIVNRVEGRRRFDFSVEKSKTVIDWINSHGGGPQYEAKVIFGVIEPDNDSVILLFSRDEECVTGPSYVNLELWKVLLDALEGL